jgi:hypothetical protein
VSNLHREACIADEPAFKYYENLAPSPSGSTGLAKSGIITYS